MPWIYISPQQWQVFRMFFGLGFWKFEKNVIHHPKWGGEMDEKHMPCNTRKIIEKSTFLDSNFIQLTSELKKTLPVMVTKRKGYPP